MLAGSFCSLVPDVPRWEGGQRRTHIPGAEIVYTPVEPAALHEAHRAQTEAERELYEVTAVGWAAQAELMQSVTEAPCLAEQ